MRRLTLPARGPRHLLAAARLLLPVLAAVLLVASQFVQLVGTPAAQAAALPPLPAGWPAANLQLGVSASPNGAAALKARAAYQFRYQYLAGGVNTGNGWATWNPDGEFVTYYVQESKDNGITPVFTYYMLLQSSPGAPGGEDEADLANLKNKATMTA